MTFCLTQVLEFNVARYDLGKVRLEPMESAVSPPGGYSPYQVYTCRYVPPQRVWFLSCFGLKMGIDFEHFGLKLGMVIGGRFPKAYKLIFLSSNRGE